MLIRIVSDDGRHGVHVRDAETDRVIPEVVGVELVLHPLKPPRAKLEVLVLGGIDIVAEAEVTQRCPHCGHTRAEGA